MIHKKICIFLRIICFVLTYVFVSSLFLLSENICGTEKIYDTKLHGWVQVSLGALFKWPYTTYVLWQKQQAGNKHVRKKEINNSWKNTNLLVDIFILKYIYIYIYIYMCVCVCVCVCVYVCGGLPIPSIRAESDTGWIFKLSVTGLNSEISFFLEDCHAKIKVASLPCNLPK